MIRIQSVHEIVQGCALCIIRGFRVNIVRSSKQNEWSLELNMFSKAKIECRVADTSWHKHQAAIP